ncbi:hypothetical protein H5410_005835, partial [Solanum commersonii]
MNILILLRHSRVWESEVRYERYRSDGIVVGENIPFINLVSAIVVELNIDELRKKIEIRYIVEGNSSSLIIRNDMRVKLYVEVKKREVKFVMYSLCTDTTDKNVGEIQVLMYRLVQLSVLKAAYTAVDSLLQTLDKQNPELFHVHTAETLDSLRTTAEYFQQLLEYASNKSEFDPENIKSLEEKIIVAANYVEDVAEKKISQIIEGTSWTFGILQHQDLLPFVEKIETTKKQVIDILSHDELKIIVNRLTRPLLDLDIVAISGMCGIDKTTLARKAYDHLTIRYHFDIFSWVTISQEFRVRNVLLEVLHCISEQTRVRVTTKSYAYMDDNELANLVQKNLKDQVTFFANVWDSIRGIFPNYNNGSRILLTTRETEVAIYAYTSIRREINLVKLENVFGPEHDHPPELEEVEKEIVKKCQGLPLTISVMTGRLSKMLRTLESWMDVSRVLSRIIASHDPGVVGVIIKGFIRTSGSGKSLEEVAIDYLEDLISRKLIQARKRRFN